MFKRRLENQGIDVEDLEQQLDGEMPDLANMDPADIKMNLQDENFRKMLENQGIDIEDLEK